MAVEEWKYIDNYFEMYEVSNLGKVRSLDRKMPTSNGFRNFKGKVLSPQLNTYGYRHVKICGSTLTIHKLVALAFIENKNNYNKISHKDGVKTNNSSDNLEWVE